MKIYRMLVGMLETNCYILICPDTKKAIIVDPGDEGEKIDRFIKSEGLDPVMVVNTHSHYDHIGADRYFHEQGIPIAINSKDAELFMSGGGAAILGAADVPNDAPDRLLSEGDIVEFGNQKVQVLFTPGHTPGHISLYDAAEKRLFCGDVLFCRSVGRTDLPGGNHWELMKTLSDKIFTLPDETKVYPGHGDTTDIGSEKKYNPCINWL